MTTTERDRYEARQYGYELLQDECDAIGADGRDGRGTLTETNLTPAERAALARYRSEREALDVEWHESREG